MEIFNNLKSNSKFFFSNSIDASVFGFKYNIDSVVDPITDTDMSRILESLKYDCNETMFKLKTNIGDFAIFNLKTDFSEEKIFEYLKVLSKGQKVFYFENTDENSLSKVGISENEEVLRFLSQREVDGKIEASTIGSPHDWEKEIEYPFFAEKMETKEMSLNLETLNEIETYYISEIASDLEILSLSIHTNNPFNILEIDNILNDYKNIISPLKNKELAEKVFSFGTETLNITLFKLKDKMIFSNNCLCTLKPQDNDELVLFSEKVTEVKNDINFPEFKKIIISHIEDFANARFVNKTDYEEKKYKVDKINSYHEYDLTFDFNKNKHSVSLTLSTGKYYFSLFKKTSNIFPKKFNFGKELDNDALICLYQKLF